ALVDRLELAVDRVLLGLLLPGNTRVDRHPEVVIGHGWSSSLGLGSKTREGRRGRLAVTAWRSRPPQGTGNDRDQGLICTRDQLVLKPGELEVAGDGGGGGGPPRGWDPVDPPPPRPPAAARPLRGSRSGRPPPPPFRRGPAP